MICVSVMKTSDLGQQHKPNPQGKICPKEMTKKTTTMLLAKVVLATNQALFNQCQDTLSCFVLYIQHKKNIRAGS